MIEIIKQDIIDSKILDTQIKIDIEITIEGSKLEEFTESLEELISKYKI